MNIPNQSLVLDLIEWEGDRPRPYDEVIRAWRTSCPRLTVWEDALDAGFVARSRTSVGAAAVEVTPAGFAFLAEHRAR